MTSEFKNSLSLEDSSFRSLIEQAPVAMALVMGPSFVVTIANKIQLELWQKTEAEVVGIELFQIFPELKSHDFHALLTNVYRSGISHKGEEVPAVFFRNGVLENAWFDFVYEAYRDGQGLVVGVMVVSTEVTERVIAKKEVQEKESFAEVILEGSADCVKILDEEGRLQFMNKNGIKLLEIDDFEPFLESYWWDLWPQDKKTIIKELVQKAGNGEIVKFQDFCPTVKGNPRWWDTVLTPAKNIDGKVTRIIAISHDITSLRDQANLLNTVIESTPDLVWAKDLEGRITLGNKATFDLLGGDKETVMRLHTDKLFTNHEVANAIQENDAKVLASGKPLKVEENVVKDGSVLVFQTIKVPLLNSSDDIVGLVGVSRDITEQKIAEENLKESKERLQASLDAAATGTFKWNIQTGELNWDENLDKLFNMPPGSSVFNRSDFIARVHPDDREKVGLEANEYAEYGEGFNTQFRVILEDGSVRWLNEKGKVFRDKEGKPWYMIGACVDITEQKDYEAALKDRESRFKKLTDSLPQMIWLANAEGTMEYISKRWEEYSGVGEYRDAWSYMVHPGDWERVYRLWQQQFLSGGSFKFEVRLRNKEGVYRWHYSLAEPLIDSAGEVVQWVGVLTDIEDQKNIAEILRKSEQYFRQMADLIPQIIWTARADGYVDYYNSRWYEYMGFKDGLGDESWISVLHPDDSQRCINEWQHSIQTGDPYLIEIRLQEATTGNYRWFLGKALCMKDADGVITRWFGTCTDIHEQKMLRVHLEHLVEDRTKELRRSNEDLRQFAHVASHDLKEPVRKVIIFGNRLKEEFEGQIPDKARGYISKMEKAARRMYSMIEGVLMYSSIDASPHAAEQVDLTTVFRDIENDLEVYIQDKKAKFSCAELPVIPGSPILIHQLFYNIIYNSLKFSKPDCDVQIDITCNVMSDHEIKILNLVSGKRYVKIIVRDNGIGFRLDESECIFNTFTRLHGKDKYEGTGLGLALCKKIVERHKGLISAQGSEGQWAEFSVILPME